MTDPTIYKELAYELQSDCDRVMYGVLKRLCDAKRITNEKLSMVLETRHPDVARALVQRLDAFAVNGMLGTEPGKPPFTVTIIERDPDRMKRKAVEWCKRNGSWLTRNGLTLIGSSWRPPAGADMAKLTDNQKIYQMVYHPKTYSDQ